MGYLFELFQSLQEKKNNYTELTIDESEPGSLIELINRMESPQQNQDVREKSMK